MFRVQHSTVPPTRGFSEVHGCTRVLVLVLRSAVGLPTLDLGIPGLSPLPPLSSPPLSHFPPSLPPSLCGFWGHPLNQLGGLGKRCKSPNGIWGEATVDKRSGVYLSRKEQLWWQQFLCIFIAINLNFCTNTRLLSSRYSVSLRAKHSVGSSGKAPGQGVTGGGDEGPLKLIMLMTFCNLMHKFVKQV